MFPSVTNFIQLRNRPQTNLTGLLIKLRPHLILTLFFNVISSAIAQLFWLITIFLICQGALKQLHTWRVLTTLLIMQQILVYGLAVQMSFLLSDNIGARNAGQWNDTIEYYIVWGAVCVGCLWAIFLVFLFVIIGHVYQKEHLKPIVIDQATKVY